MYYSHSSLINKANNKIILWNVTIFCVYIFFVECGVDSNVAGKNSLNHQSSLGDYYFFTKTQLIALEPTFRKMKIYKMKLKSIKFNLL